MTPFVRYWLPVLAHMALTFYFSHQPRLPGPPMSIPYFDKIMHASFFGLLAFLFLRAWLKGDYSFINLKTVGVTLLFVGLYGLSDEFHQSFIPTRSPDLADWLADMTGAVVVCVTVFFMWGKPMNTPTDS